VQQPSTQNIYELFNGRIQFQVPVYQRAYVWNEEENWEVLWGDIEETTNRYLSEPESHVRHFLGPIVLSQEHSNPGGVDPRLVIDGQQRLTTLQIILSAAAAVAEAHGASEVATELAELTRNRGHTAAAGDLRFKIWPSRRDRESFLRTMDGEREDGAGGIPAAWGFFYARIEEWTIDGGEAEPTIRQERLRALQTCLDSLIYVVSINLDEGDNAQVIFETLNARGTGLGALDLVKNATFLQAEREKAAAEQLHDEVWEPTFEADDYWLDELRQGRDRRARADWFLMHWLALELAKVVRADTLFDTFRKEILRGGVTPPMDQLVRRLCEDATTMRSFDDLEPGSAEALFFSRMEAMDTTTMLPVALFLFRTDEIGEARRRRALLAIESWLVRRAILRLTSRNYNRTLASLLRAIKEEPERADEAIARELRSSSAATAVWPSDDEIRDRLLNGELYGYVGQARVRMLLEACELDARDSSKTEAIVVPGGLTIEHAMPTAWEEHWPVNGADPAQAAEDRDAHVDRLGNLTLVTQPLNSSMSNAPWLKSESSPYSKRDELTRRSVLLINQRLCQHDEWNEDLIDERSADLADRILRTWPGPDSETW
jgi:hypothetical protein